MDLSQESLQKIIKEIKGAENNERMEKSQTEWDLYTGNIREYVVQHLIKRYDIKFTEQLPVCSSINPLKRSVNDRATVYKTPPEREFKELSDEQKEKMHLVYQDAGINFRMNEADKLFTLQKEQTHVLVEIKSGKICLKPLKAHQINALINEIDSEIADAYILSAYDKGDNSSKINSSDGTNQAIADQDDYKKLAERYIFWSKEYHFVFNGKGEIITDDIVNPIGMMPIVEISQLKDFNYWREVTNDEANFTIDYNVDMTMLQHIVELQGFSQAYLKAPKSIMPDTIQVGPSKILRLVTDDLGQDNVDFGYASPSSDVAGSMDFYSKKLSMTMSSQGNNPALVTGSVEAEKYTSGTDRFLAQVEKSEKAREKMELFKLAEKQIYKIICAWLNVASGTDKLNPIYSMGIIPQNTELEIKMAEPTIAISEIDRIDIAERKVNLGLWDTYDAYAYVEQVSRERAIEVLGEAQAPTLMNNEVV